MPAALMTRVRRRYRALRALLFGCRRATPVGPPRVGATLAVALLPDATNGATTRVALQRPSVGTNHCCLLHDGPTTSDWLKRATGVDFDRSESRADVAARPVQATPKFSGAYS